MAKKCILIVDDEEELREILAYQLEPLGFTIETAENGRVALERAIKGGVIAILSDLSMPEMTVLELLAGLRRKGFETPFVIITGFSDKTKANEAQKLGAFEFLEKPWEPEMLRETMRRAVEFGDENT